MQSPLPSVEATCSSLQQEESQKEILSASKLNIEISAMYNKGVSHERGCFVCGGKYHTAEACCHVIGFPKGHPKNKKQSKYNTKEETSSGASRRWNNPKTNKMVANVQSQNEAGPAKISQQQLEQLLKLLPSISKATNLVQKLKKN